MDSSSPSEARTAPSRPRTLLFRQTARDHGPKRAGLPLRGRLSGRLALARAALCTPQPPQPFPRPPDGCGSLGAPTFWPRLGFASDATMIRPSTIHARNRIARSPEISGSATSETPNLAHPDQLANHLILITYLCHDNVQLFLSTLSCTAAYIHTHCIDQRCISVVGVRP